MIMLLLFLTGMLAGTVDAIAGGGGLISLPVLIAVGLPPHLAFGTNKLQSSFGTMMAARRYLRTGMVSLKDVYFGIVLGLFGSASGAVVNQIISGEILRKIVPLLLSAIFLYTLLSPRLGNTDQNPRIRNGVFYVLFGFALAFYDGFFGPGVGAFWVFLMMFFLGYNMMKATAYSKVFNLNSNIVALCCFAAGANIDYKIGLCMAAGQIIGGQLGASLAISKGVKLIRPLFLTMVFVTISVLTYRNYGDSFLRLIAFNQHKYAYLPVLASLLLGLAVFLIRRFQNQDQRLLDRM